MGLEEEPASGSVPGDTVEETEREVVKAAVAGWLITELTPDWKDGKEYEMEGWLLKGKPDVRNGNGGNCCLANLVGVSDLVMTTFGEPEEEGGGANATGAGDVVAIVAEGSIVIVVVGRGGLLMAPAPPPPPPPGTVLATGKATVEGT